MAHFFLSPELEADDCVPGEQVSILGDEARHAATVARVRVGEELLIGNGRGLVIAGTVMSADPARVVVVVVRPRHVSASSPRIHLAQALAKGGRDELAVQAATELGVDSVIPWSAQRSISRWEGNKVAKGRARWQSIVHEAAKQSQRAWVPDVAALTSSIQLASLGRTMRTLVLEPSGTRTLSGLEFDGSDLLLVVGPEGGVAPGELELFTRAGAELVRLGDTILRTSTAGPAAIAVLNSGLGRW